jgi:hypothetical protein
MTRYIGGSNHYQYLIPSVCGTTPAAAAPAVIKHAPRIIGPLQYIRSCRPHVYTSAGTLRSPDLDEANRLHRKGDSEGLQRLAQKIWLENNK